MATKFNGIIIKYAVFALTVCLTATKQPAEGASQIFNITCDYHDLETCQSPSLKEIANVVVGQPYLDLMIDINVLELYLNTTVNFTNLSSLTISGEPNVTTIICTSNSSGAGFVLTDILDKVSLSNLNLTSCGSLFKNVFKDNQIFISALTLVHCSNMEINSLIVERSRGLGMTILNHQGGRVNINSSIFKENQLSQEQIVSGKNFGGGGMYILLGQYISGPHVYSPMTFQFVNCTFLRNIAHTKHYDVLFTDVMGNPQEGYGRGGSVHVSVKHSLDHVHMLFLGCKFIANQAFIGGGLSVEMHGESEEATQEMKNITVEVISSMFEHNGCRIPNRTYFGGGIHLSFSTLLHHSAINDCHYLVRNVSFVGNCAELGGGVVYSFDRRSIIATNNSLTVLFDNCTFERNTAHIGSAVDITPNIFLKVLNGFAVAPIFMNCYFLKNFVTVNDSQSVQITAGVGTIYASISEIHFLGYNRFVSNRGSAVYVVNGIVNFQHSDANFTNNFGLHGGAIALIGSSMIIIGPSNYKFINNTASYQGGAIYVYLIDSTDFITSRSCFIQYRSENDTILTSKWNANVTFIGNKAKDNSSGHAIYATSLHPCQVVISGTPNQPTYTLMKISKVFKIKGVRFDNNQSLQPQVSTDGAQLHQSKPSPLLIIPGEKYKHGVTITDDFDLRIATLFRASINRNTKNIELDPSLSSFIGDKVQLRGKPEQMASLYLQTVSPRQSYIRLEVKLLECPPGFRLNNNSQCVCNVESYVGLFKCDLDNVYSHLLPGFWAGLLAMGNESELVTSPCPFCDYSSSASNATEFEVILPRSSSELDETVCGRTRTGIVCGMCQDSYTVHFHSPGFLCKAEEPFGCRLGWLFYFLSELVPVTAVFITVLVLNISFTSGTVNGFILFSQLLGTLDIDASGIIPFPESARDTISGWTQGYKVIYGFLNLDYFSFEPMSFCLWKGATALDMLAFKYVTILYALLLIVAVVWIMNQCGGRYLGKVCRITAIKTSVVHGISTFLVICYAQCIKVSLSLLIPVDIRTEENSSFRPDHRVWLNGNILYFSNEHLRYALPAIFCLLTIGLLPPALLLAYPLLNRVLAVLGCENIRIINYIPPKISFNKLKPIFDSIQGCFKDNFRFFAGLYFLYRWLVLIIYMNTRGFSAYYTAVGGVFLLVLTIHTICQPYIKRVHNIIDTLLFANLVLINSLSFFNYYRSRSLRDIEQGRTVLPATVQLVLIYLPMVVMCVYLVMILCKNVEKCGCKKLSAKTLPFCGQKIKLREFIRTISAQDDSNSNDEEFTHDRLVDEDINYTSRYLNAESELDTAPFSTYT